ncbi:hypothetical protein D3C79_1115420 [compost metagenome]
MIAQANDAHVSGQLKVSGAIAYHVAVGFIERFLGQILFNQFHFRLAAVAVVSR